MIKMIAAVMTFFPASAFACGSMSASGGGCAGGHACGVLAIALMAGVAALGSWVLRSAEKDSGAGKRAGQLVGWALVIVGLLGFFCGAVSHAVKVRSGSCHTRSASGDANLPFGHPPIKPLEK